MKVIKPSQMSPSLLVSDNILEEYPEWSSTTTYAEGAKVVRTPYGVYESLVAGNINKQPELETSSTHWILVGPTNHLAMFDTQISTVTTGSLDITATVKVGSIDSIALLNLVGARVTLTIRNGNGGPIIYGPATKSLQGDDIIDWYDYFFFEEEAQRTQALFLDLPLGYTNAHATFTVSGAGPVSIGAFIFGTISKLGNSEYGATAGIADYSTKETDQYGTTTFVVREFSKKLTVDIQIDNTSLNRVQRTLYQLRATPAVWIAADDARLEEAMIVFGFYRDFSTNISYPTVSRCSIEVEGLI